MKFEHYTSAMLRKRDRNRWQGVLKYKDEDGCWKSKYRSFAGIKFKRDAEEELRLWREEEEPIWNEENVGRAHISENVAEYLEHHIDMIEQTGGAARSTIANYRFVLKHIVNHPIGSVRVKDLDAEITERWIAQLVKEGKSPATVRKSFNVLHVGIRHAVETHKLPYDPIAFVRLPKIPKKLPNVLDEIQRARLVEHLDSMEVTQANVGIALALYTGMREGEICALRWTDVDLNNEQLIVQRSIGTDGNTTFVKETKTVGSTRILPISASLSELLRRRKAYMANECANVGLLFKETMYVIGTIEGGLNSYMRPKMLWRNWKMLANSMGFVGTQGKVPTFHDLRHTYATVAVASGADIKSVQGLLGHASAKTTLDIYAAHDISAMRKAVAAADNSIREKRFNSRMKSANAV